MLKIKSAPRNEKRDFFPFFVGGGGGLCGLEGDFVNDVTKNNLPHPHRPQHTASKIDFLRLARRHNVDFFVLLFRQIVQ
jgi:hypothetical protein